MTKSREELVARALAKLKVVGAGQTASAEVSDRVDDVVEPLMADLSARQIFSWGDEDELPDSAFEHLADCLAHAAAPDFGKVYGGEPELLLFEKKLRNLNLYSLSGQNQTTEYF